MLKGGWTCPTCGQFLAVDTPAARARHRRSAKHAKRTRAQPHTVVEFEHPRGYAAEFRRETSLWELKRADAHCGLFATCALALEEARRLEGIAP